MPKFDPAVSLGPWKGGQEFGTVLSYLQATKLKTPLKIHPLLECLTWDPKPYGKYISWNITAFPDCACIYIDYDATATERFQPATWPKVEELHILHDGSGWTVRIRNRLGVNITDVLEGIFNFFASPLYVDELGEMHPRAVRVMEQQYFEKRSLGFFDAFEGYRKSDALLGLTYFNGIRWMPDFALAKLNFKASNVFVMNLGNC